MNTNKYNPKTDKKMPERQYWLLANSGLKEFDCPYEGRFIWQLVGVLATYASINLTGAKV